ncbi:MAG: hypothetical protein LBQ98_03710 [Nitrososphaerota archaeon]|nr:hypothetical protein [Nitrososphaerota archaeon]
MITLNFTKTVLEKYWLSAIFFLLCVFSVGFSYLAVVAALVFTFFVPGLICYRFVHLKTYELWAFIPVFSVLVSVMMVYFFSLVLGYSQWTIVLCFVILTLIYTGVIYKKGEPLKPKTFLKLTRIKKDTLLIFSLVFLIVLGVLCFSVWRGNDYGIVITGSNWQDTPFHYEIIESLNQGNFPPQTPNYIGTPLTYHYFVDFHVAIVEKMYGYLPTLLPVLNAVFISVFAAAIYALARFYSRRAALIAVVLGVFGWGLSYVGLFSALFNGSFNSYQNYIYQFGQLFGLPSIFDNLLQQRPLLIGLPVFVLVLALLRDMSNQNRLLLAGVLTGLVYPFHNMAFFCCYVAFAAAVILNMRKLNKGYLYFFLPSIFALPFIFSSGPSIAINFSTAFITDFAQNPLLYYVLNLGVPLILALISFIRPGQNYLKLTLIALLVIPNILLLTPWSWDMYKFFMFAWIPIVVLSGIVLSKTPKIIALTLILLSILTASSVIIYNVGTEFTAVTWSEYQLGMWVRDNIPENAIFLTYYSIQCPPSMIAGRLRVSSYVYWPYGHGVPLSEVQAREKAIDNAYTGSESQLLAVIQEYNVSYVYIGRDEQRNYPDCVAKLDAVDYLSQIYANDDLYIYQIVLAKDTL